MNTRPDFSSCSETSADMRRDCRQHTEDFRQHAEYGETRGFCLVVFVLLRFEAFALILRLYC